MGRAYRLGLLKTAELEKSAASRLRKLLNAGKLTAEQISKFRSSGMLPSRKDYMAGIRKMLESRLSKIESTAKHRGIDLRIQPVLSDRGASGVTVSYPSTRIGSDVSRFTHVVDPKKTDYHVIELPSTLRRTDSGTLDAGKMRLHDIVTANHEIDEYLGYFKNGGFRHWYNPNYTYGVDATHFPGVLPAEKRLYTRIARQLGIANPDWSRYKTSGSHRRLPNEVAEGAFRNRDYGLVDRLIAKTKSYPIHYGYAFDQLASNGADINRRILAMLPAGKKYDRVRRYFESHPVIRTMPNGETGISSENLHEFKRQIPDMYPYDPPKRFTVVDGTKSTSLWKWYTGKEK